MADESPYSRLSGQAKGLVQQHIVLDAQDRPVIIYTAAIGAVHGEPCTKVSYSYKDATSTVVVAMKEENDTWDQTFQPPLDPSFFQART